MAALVLALLLTVVSPASADPQLDTSHPVAFFTNLASRLLKAELNLDLHRLQIHPTNQYTPAVHRLLQVIHESRGLAGPRHQPTEQWRF